LENYGEIVQPYLKEEDNLILVDTSEVVKSAASKMEALGRVRDGTTGTIEDGYWTTNMIAVSPKKKHPIPVYSHLYSSAEVGFISENEETYKGFAMWTACSVKRRPPLSWITGMTISK